MNFLLKIDEEYLKPFFIYKYDKVEARKGDEFIELFEKEGDKWGELYQSPEFSLKKMNIHN